MLSAALDVPEKKCLLLVLIDTHTRLAFFRHPFRVHGLSVRGSVTAEKCQLICIIRVDFFSAVLLLLLLLSFVFFVFLLSFVIITHWSFVCLFIWFGPILPLQTKKIHQCQM